MTALLLSLSLAMPSPAKELGRVSSKDGLIVTFRASSTGNLAYQLNCLAGIGICTRGAFRSFWQTQSWTPDDAAAIERWGALMSKYDRHVDLERDDDSDAALPLEPRGIGLLERIRIAGYRAETWDDWRSGLELLMTADDAREAIALAGRFRERFDSWWAKQGRERAESAATSFRDMALKHDLPSFYGKAARFYGYAYPAGTIVEFDVMAQPDNDAKMGHGECLGDHAVVEIDPHGRNERKLTVVSHELFHYFFKQAPRRVREALISGFADSPDRDAFAAYALFNEAVATALGQGLVARMIDKAEYDRRYPLADGFYAERAVNDAARALVEPLGGCLERGATIADAGFVAEYLDAVTTALGPRLSAAEARFRAFEAVHGPYMNAAQDKFSDLAHPNSVWGHSFGPNAVSFAERHSGLTVVMFLRPDELPELKNWGKVLAERDRRKIEARAKDARPFAYVAPRSDKAYSFVFVGKDADALAPVIGKFFAAKSLASGLLP